jgi:hypothetical protein
MHPKGRPRRWPWIVAGVVVVLVVAFAVVSALIDEPLRRRLQARVNAQLKGYHVAVGELDLQPLDFAVILKDVKVTQDAHPTPPIATLPRWRTSLQWRALLSGALVGDVLFDRPQLHITVRQGEAEVTDPVPVEERGWQDAVEAVYPLRINEIRVEDGSVTYVDDTKLPPIKVQNLQLRAQDIRNVRSEPGRFPSPFSGECTIQDKGRLRVDGHADFLAKPSVAFRSRFSVRNLGMAVAQPLVRHVNLAVHGGTMATTGRIESARGRTVIDIADLQVDHPHIDYLHETATAAKEEERIARVARAGTTVEGSPQTQVDIERARLVDGELGLMDWSAKPPYRVFVKDLQVDLRDFSNQRADRSGNAHIVGRFMDSGPATLDASFAPAARQADFSLDMQVRDVDLRSLNDVLRARGGFDVNAGQLSIYSQIDVGKGRISGYVKPLFTNVDVYDRRQDAGKGPMRQLYEGLVGGAATLLENRHRDDVATIADVSGPIENPNTSTIEIVLRLVRNAFFKAILPGLEREREPPKA